LLQHVLCHHADDQNDSQDRAINREAYDVRGRTPLLLGKKPECHPCWGVCSRHVYQSSLPPARAAQNCKKKALSKSSVMGDFRTRTTCRFANLTLLPVIDRRTQQLKPVRMCPRTVHI